MPKSLAPVALMALALLAAPPGVHAQDGGDRTSPDAISSALASSYAGVRSNIEAAAELVSESDYSYRPTEEVRSFGDLVAHLTDAQFLYCSAAAGDDSPAPVARIEGEVSAKGELVSLLKQAGEYCAGLYRSADVASLAEEVNLFGSQQSRAAILTNNVGHDNLHYGNMVTYIRELGLVPPSSQGGG